MSKPSLDLSTLIVAVREELEKADAQLRAAAKPTLFQLSSMELELNFVVKTSSEVGGKFDLKIISLGSKLAESGEEVQKITVRFDASDQAIRAKLPGSRFYDQDEPQDQDVRPVKPLK